MRPPRDQYRDRHPGTDDIFWVIEVSDSSLTKDLELKRQLYVTARINEYWVIDLTKKQLIVFRSSEGIDYLFKQEISVGKIAPLAFPEVEVAVDQLLV